MVSTHFTSGTVHIFIDTSILLPLKRKVLQECLKYCYSFCFVKLPSDVSQATWTVFYRDRSGSGGRVRRPYRARLSLCARGPFAAVA